MNPLVDWLFEGVGAETFFRTYWGQQALHLKRTSDFYEGLISGSELLEATFSGKVAYPLLDIRRNGINDWNGVLNDDKTYNYDTLHRYYAEGLTFHYRHVEDFTTASDLLEAYKEAIGGTFAYISAWLSPSPTKHWIHYDALDALILQIEGEKEWRLYESYELGTKNFDGSREHGQMTAEYNLTPGDLLYVPRGMFHSAQANDHSLHLVIPHDALTTGEMLLALVKEMNTCDTDFWKNLPLDYATNPRVKEMMYQTITKLSVLGLEMLPQIKPATTFVDPIKEQGYGKY